MPCRVSVEVKTVHKHIKSVVNIRDGLREVWSVCLSLATNSDTIDSLVRNRLIHESGTLEKQRYYSKHGKIAMFLLDLSLGMGLNPSFQKLPLASILTKQAS